MGTLGKAVNDLILVAGKVCVERLKLVNCKKIKRIGYTETYSTKKRIGLGLGLWSCSVCTCADVQESQLNI